MARFKKKLPESQKWDPPMWLNVLYKIWLVLFTTFKIAVGAVSTVVLIGVVCAFSFAGVLGEYLESDILPNANLVLESYELAAPSTVYCVNEAGQIQVQQELYASTDWKKADYEDIPQALIDAAVAIEDLAEVQKYIDDMVTTVQEKSKVAMQNCINGMKTMQEIEQKNYTLMAQNLTLSASNN